MSASDNLPIQKIKFDADDIQMRVCALAQEISRDFSGQELIVIGVLKGALYFLSDLTRRLSIPVILDFIEIGTYPGTSSRGIVQIKKDVDTDITGKQVLVVEDIIRTGLTTAYLMTILRARSPANIKLCTLLQNSKQSLIDLPVAYKGFEISEERLLGYGLDIDQRGRALPYIAEIKKPN